MGRPWVVNGINNNHSNANGNNNLNNDNGRLVGIDQHSALGISFFCLVGIKMYEALCSYENLELAFLRARKGKTQKPYVVEFEVCLKENLLTLRNELLMQTYEPKPLSTFILRDPKTRKISRSDFRDRIIHHALCNIIEPLFEKNFIYDSYANRKWKGTLKAIERFEYFKRKVTKNFSTAGFAMKADVKHYFETVDHGILIFILKKKIGDQRIIWLIEKILSNYRAEKIGKGMPLGNLTSQFFANIYLNELDQFAKHQLKAEYYLRYVDDFVILHTSPKKLYQWKKQIEIFLTEKLLLSLHPDKSKVLKIQRGVTFLGFRIFPRHRRIKVKNIRKFEKKLGFLREKYQKGSIEREKVVEIFEGWLAYLSHANMYKYQSHLLRRFSLYFPIQKEVPTPLFSKEKNILRKIDFQNTEFTAQKTLQLFRRNWNIKDVANRRNIKEATVWKHLANLIEYNQLSLWEVLPRERVEVILLKIYTENDKLKEIKERIRDISVTFDEISCVLAFVKNKNNKKELWRQVEWYKKAHCMRKCYFNQKQQRECRKKFELLISKEQNLMLKREEFLTLLNFHTAICVLPLKQKLRYISWKEFQTIRKLPKPTNS